MIWFKALRIHQWLKNLLLFVPLVAAHQVMDNHAVLLVTIAFFSFSFCASSVYIINDLLDIEADRAHPRKKRRPFASGTIPPIQGIYAIPILLALSATLASQLPWIFILTLASYFAVTCLYTFWLKRQVIVDVLLLASLYTFRVLAGSAATGIAPSFWLLAFSMFVFLSLSLVKRYSEMVLITDLGRESTIGRGYFAKDAQVLLSLGASAGQISTLVLALYINSPDVGDLYPNRWCLWLLLPPFLYWMTRIWLKANRGEVHDDPLVFAVTDWQSWCVAACAAIALGMATWKPV